MTTQVEPNEYGVRCEETADGWSVSILEATGEVAFARACANEEEARTFASTIRQHIFWLSPQKFREYYRIGDAAAASSGHVTEGA